MSNPRRIFIGLTAGITMLTACDCTPPDTTPKTYTTPPDNPMVTQKFVMPGEVINVDVYRRIDCETGHVMYREGSNHSQNGPGFTTPEGVETLRNICTAQGKHPGF